MSGVAQWLACWAHNPKVRGSKPRSAILFFLCSFCIVVPHVTAVIHDCENRNRFVVRSLDVDHFPAQ